MQVDEKLIFIDTETTGRSEFKNSIYQIGGIVQVNGKVVDDFDIIFRPRSDKEIDPAALAASNRTVEWLYQQVDDYTDAYKQLISILEKHINRYDPLDKADIVAYNATFDDRFLRAFFMDNNDKFYGSWFRWPAIDVAIFAAELLRKERPFMKDFKLGTVCAKLGITLENAHDAMADILATKELYEECLRLLKEDMDE